MSWREKTNVTKSSINKLGIKLGNSDFSDELLEKLNFFRYGHESATEDLLEICKGSELVEISSRRLKRTPSIVEKLIRNIKRGTRTRLSTMQDIGGCRCIFKNIDDIYAFIDWMKSQRKPFKLVKCNDYIAKPKKDGYRGIHLIYQVSNQRDDGELFIELQLRTHKQHAWATSVEILDMVTNDSIKVGGGKPYHKKFFRLTSSLIENSEGIKTSSRKKAKRVLPQLDRQYGIIHKLGTRAMTYDFYNKKVKTSPTFRSIWSKKRDAEITGDVILIIKRGSNNKYNVTARYNLTLEEAQKQYVDLEKAFIDDPNTDIVYLSSLEIVNAYPNYLGTAKEFIKLYNSLFAT